jgi:beta-lactam-binding protein with PASTA domain
VTDAPLAIVGKLLLEARQAKGVTLSQAEAITRVRAKYLRALEEADAAALPEPLYVKGFLRSYARYLGLDAASIVSQYDRSTVAAKTRAVVKPAISPLRLSANAWTGIIIGLLVFGLFAAGLAYLYQQYAAAAIPPTPVAILEIPTPTPTATATRIPVLEVTVPDLVNRELAAAELDLRALGLTVAVGDRRYDTRIAAGSVVTQSVPSGIKIRQGATITVVLSLGRQGLSVPNVVNIPFDQARGILTNAGFAVNRVDQPSSQAAAGVVFRQDPAPLSAAAAGSAVTIYVSQGGTPPPATGKVTVPNIVGRPWVDAQKTLQAAGLSFTVHLQNADLVPPGAVLSTSPGAGAQVDPGANIDVAVRRE